jgi:hypothetical protein
MANASDALLDRLALKLGDTGERLIGVRERRHAMPFAMTVIFFIAGFLTLAVLFWPYMIPYQVTRGRRSGAERLALVSILGRARHAAGDCDLYRGGLFWAFRGKRDTGSALENLLVSKQGRRK